MFKPVKLLFPFIGVSMVLIFSGCSHVVYPRAAIPVKMDAVGSMDVKREVSFINGVADSKLTLIATQGSHKYFADYKQWAGLIVSQLESELKNRGVSVQSDGGAAFKVAVESVGLFWGSFATRSIVRFRVEKMDGTWTKTYEVNNASGHFHRTFDGAAHKAVVAILSDQDFKNAMR
ncbi:MAG: hypothetical protein A2V86_12660 [Deltaproteobacteria bacterium RBG_16_49_23]|nr:MAG: hypothetical protein A2V86_12660 [Deltaproteobacteria bacterium RBG_16_49_23]